MGTIDSPLSQLLAAGVLLRRGNLGKTDIAIAVDTASAQGWRRALLAWLGLVLLACGGLVVTGSELTAIAGALVGVAISAYLEFGATLPAGAPPGAGGGQWRVEVTLGGYLLMLIALTVIWPARPRPS